MFGSRSLFTVFAATLATAVVGMAAPAAAQPLSIVIINNDGAGEGFNDPTPVAPVGGNPGATLGAQRLIVFQQAAAIWGANLTSSMPVRVVANFDALTCTATGAVLGSAGARFINRDFTGALRPATWYGEALANKLAGVDTVPNEPEIGARFNSNLGQTGCLTGSFFYYGLDNVVPAGQVNLLVVVLHELAHGLGFQTFTNGTTGAQPQGFPSAYDYELLDTTQNLTWVQMTNAQRVASAVNTRRLVWTGANVTNASSMLALGTPQLVATAPASLAGDYLVGSAAFGPPLTSPGTAGEVMPVIAQAGGTGPGCEPFNAVNTLAVAGKIALIDRGICGFAVKTKNAQNAGAIGVIIANNTAGSPPPGLGGADPTVVIPTVSITQADATLFYSALRFRSRTRSGVFVTMGLNLAQRAGADALGRVLVFTPNPFQGGSSVSHWDTSTFPNLLMEPAINANLTQILVPPYDLTRPFMLDLGW
jgi:PA domain